MTNHLAPDSNWGWGPDKVPGPESGWGWGGGDRQP